MCPQIGQEWRVAIQREFASNWADEEHSAAAGQELAKDASAKGTCRHDRHQAQDRPSQRLERPLGTGARAGHQGQREAE